MASALPPRGTNAPAVWAAVSVERRGCSPPRTPALEQHKLWSEALGIGRSRLLRKLQEQRSNPGALLVGDFFDATSRASFRAGAYEGAPTEPRLREGQTLHFEHPDPASAMVAVMAVLLGTDGWVGSLEAVESGTQAAVRSRREAELR